MKVYQVEEEFAFENLRMTERPDPTPASDEVVIRTGAATLNFRDLFMLMHGAYGAEITLPMIPLSDGVGEVVETGEDVTRVQKGDRVSPIFTQSWTGGRPKLEDRATTMGGPLDGMLAEQVAVSEEGVVRVPEHLEDAEAASLPCAGVTAWNALTKYKRLKAGDIVLLEGTGGVSVFGLQFGKLLGARTIITSSQDEKLERARDLGADETINYESDPDWDETVLELTDGDGVDHVLDVGGTETLTRALNCAHMGAQISVIGLLSGTDVEANVGQILMKRLHIQGIGVGSRDDFEDMNRAIAANQMRPVVDRVFPFEDAPEAFKYMQQQRHFGKIAIEF